MLFPPRLLILADAIEGAKRGDGKPALARKSPTWAGAASF
jgi:hypothetical protein